MGKYTPGPWIVWDDDPWIVVAGDGFSICDASPGNPLDVPREAAVANARLIAAAPELLEALRGCVGQFESYATDPDKWPAYKAAQRAIIKATR